METTKASKGLADHFRDTLKDNKVPSTRPKMAKE